MRGLEREQLAVKASFYACNNIWCPWERNSIGTLLVLFTPPSRFHTFPRFCCFSLFKPLPYELRPPLSYVIVLLARPDEISRRSDTSLLRYVGFQPFLLSTIFNGLYWAALFCIWHKCMANFPFYPSAHQNYLTLYTAFSTLPVISIALTRAHSHKVTY